VTIDPMVQAYEYLAAAEELAKSVGLSVRWSLHCKHRMAELSWARYTGVCEDCWQATNRYAATSTGKLL